MAGHWGNGGAKVSQLVQGSIISRILTVVMGDDPTMRCSLFRCSSESCNNNFAKNSNVILKFLQNYVHMYVCNYMTVINLLTAMLNT